MHLSKLGTIVVIIIIVVKARVIAARGCRVFHDPDTKVRQFELDLLHHAADHVLKNKERKNKLVKYSLFLFTIQENA
jgi:hypothetical protein